MRSEGEETRAGALSPDMKKISGFEGSRRDMWP